MRPLWFSLSLLVTSLYGGVAAAQTTVQIVPVGNEGILFPIDSGYLDRLRSCEPYSLPWNRVSEQDIEWQRRVWREIDLSLPENKAMATVTAPGSTELLALLYQGIQAGKYKAYAPGNDRFTQALSVAEVNEQLNRLVETAKDKTDPLHLTSYRLKEDYLRMKNGQMLIRIIGIAPETTRVGGDGKTVTEPLFWIYYPESRQFLAEHLVGAGNDPSAASWDQFFETRQFKGKIVKVWNPASRCGAH
jgi:gliding motility associated protien GldN